MKTKAKNVNPRNNLFMLFGRCDGSKIRKNLNCNVMFHSSSFILGVACKPDQDSSFNISLCKQAAWDLRESGTSAGTARKFVVCITKWKMHSVMSRAQLSPSQRGRIDELCLNLGKTLLVITVWISLR